MLFVRRPTRRGVSRVPHRTPMHGILLLGGSGSRMRGAWVGNKHLIPIAGRPMADYGLELLTLCGVEAITAVVRPDDEQVRHAYRSSTSRVCSRSLADVKSIAARRHRGREADDFEPVSAPASTGVCALARGSGERSVERSDISG